MTTLYNRRQPGDGLPPVKAIVVHHTTAPPEREPWALAQWQVTQTDRDPYPEVTYHLYIYLANGEWRCAWLLDLEACSWHADGKPTVYNLLGGRQLGYANVESVAVAIAGDWSTERPPEEALAMLEKAIAWLERRFGRALERWGHRDVEGANTRCPGDWWVNGQG